MLFFNIFWLVKFSVMKKKKKSSSIPSTGAVILPLYSQLDTFAFILPLRILSFWGRQTTQPWQYCLSFNNLFQSYPWQLTMTSRCWHIFSIVFSVCMAVYETWLFSSAALLFDHQPSLVSYSPLQLWLFETLWEKEVLKEYSPFPRLPA